MPERVAGRAAVKLPRPLMVDEGPDRIELWPVSPLVIGLAGTRAAILLAALCAHRPGGKYAHLPGLTMARLIRATWFSRRDLKVALSKLIRLGMAQIHKHLVDGRTVYTYSVNRTAPKETSHGAQGENG